MTKYSILFEAERFHEIGPFRFPVYEDLTPGESRKIEELAKRNSRSTYESMKLARRIAHDHKLKISEALKVLENIGKADNQEYLFEYAEDVEKLTNHSLSELEQRIEYVTIFMRFRGQVKLPPSEEWARSDDWTTEDTEALTKKRLNQIYDLVLRERDGWPEAIAEGKSTAAKAAA
jgi:hypothetical protein